MKTSLLPLVSAVLLSGCVVYVGNGHARDLQHEERSLQLEAAQLQQLVADTGAGKLEIVGETDRSDISVMASIYYYKAEDIRLSLERKGTNAVLEAGFDQQIHYGNSPYIDLLIKVPARLALTLEDGSGDTVIRGLTGKLHIDDGSGDMEINGGGAAVIEDGSGDLTISNLTGALLLEDGSGNTRINNIAGDVNVDDGSGNLILRQIGGVVTIDDGSGDIDVDGAKGLNIINGGSGGLKINAIDGPVSIDD